MDDSKSLRTVVIGYGHIGRRHVALARELPHYRLEGIIEIERNRDILDDWPGGVELFPTLEAFLKSGKIADLAIVATPNGTHKALAIEGLQAGMNVLVEKPMALTFEDCLEMNAEAARMEKMLFVVKQNRFSPPVSWLREAIIKGVFGEIRSVEINCFWNRDDRYYLSEGQRNWRGTPDMDGGVLFTQFSHFIDILYWIFGDIVINYTEIDNLGHVHISDLPDTGVTLFRLKNKAIGSLHFTTAIWDKNMESSFTVIGEKGTVRIGGQYMDQITYFHVRGEEIPQLKPSSPPNNYGTYTGSAGNHRTVLENVASAITKGEESGVISGKEAAEVVRIIESIYKKGQSK